MAGAVMTRKPLDAQAQEHAPDLGRYSVNPVQTVQTSVIVAIGKRPIASRSLPYCIVKGHGCRQTPGILGDRRYHVREDLAERPVHFEPRFGPVMELRGSCSEEFPVVVGPLVGEFFSADQRVDQLIAL